MKLPLVAAACLLMAGCSSGGTEHVVVTVDHAVSLADQPVHLKVTGLQANKSVSIGADTVDLAGHPWHGEATFTADDHGTVDLTTAKPSSGSYQDVDGMGLFWSMDPANGDPDEQSYAPPTKDGHSIEQLEISASRDGKRLAGTTLTRQWTSSGVTTTPVTTAKDKLTGLYIAPKPDGAKHPAVLYFGGSEGGMPVMSIPLLLASHGYPVLAVAYFHAPGVPEQLRNIPIEYFATAARWLDQQPGVDPAHVVALSASYGTEAALLLADHFPALVHGAVLFAPSASGSESFPQRDGLAWTYRGQPIDVDPIPVDGVAGPVLAVAGSDDLVWGSRFAAEQIIRELDEAQDKFPHDAVIVTGAGHGITGPPYLPHGTSIVHPVTGKTDLLGGTRAADESGQRQGWTKTLALLAALQH